MTLGRRQQRLLGALAATLAVALVLRLGGDDEVGLTETLAARTARLRSRAAETPVVTDVVALDVEGLSPSSGAYEAGRNPFRFGKVEAPPPPPPPRQEKPVVVAPPPPPPPRETGPRPPSASHLKFLGSFGPEQRRIAVVISGEDIYNVREGQRVEEKFIVQEIGYESVAIGFVGFPDEPPRRLPVGG